MRNARRTSTVILLTLLCAILLVAFLPSQWLPATNRIWSLMSGTDQRVYTDDVDPHEWQAGREKGRFKEPQVNPKSRYPVGRTKPAGSKYTRTIVMPKLREENTTWIEAELGDMLASGLLDTAIYVMDDPTAPLHPVVNKGHEVMAYLSYMIDFYDDLPDVAIFMHAHQFAYHNNLLLDKDSAQMVRHLSPERVTREGYMNLRCHWDPGCPEWLRPNDVGAADDRLEQRVMAASWAELFPGQRLPNALAQPCCAQFAVSRERLRAIPKERLLALRGWVINTDLEDFLSGRIFEYTWQVIFTASPFHCPSMSACYCDGYGICFGDAEKFDYYFELEHYLKVYQDALEGNSVAMDDTDTGEHATNDPFYRKELLDVPIAGRREWLEKEVSRIEGEMTKRKAEALELGKDPRQRALESRRNWEEGDGF